MKKYEVKKSHSLWIMTTAMLNQDGSLISHSSQSGRSAITMWETYQAYLGMKTQFEDKPDPTVWFHLNLIQVLDFQTAGTMARSEVAWDELEFYAKEEQAVYAAQSALIVI